MSTQFIYRELLKQIVAMFETRQLPIDLRETLEIVAFIEAAKKSARSGRCAGRDQGLRSAISPLVSSHVPMKRIDPVVRRGSGRGMGGRPGRRPGAARDDRHGSLHDDAGRGGGLGPFFVDVGEGLVDHRRDVEPTIRCHSREIGPIG